MVATKDHHVDPGAHWSATPDFRESWPVHCGVGTEGEAFHPNLDPQPFDAIFLKGEHEAAYSGFEGRTSTASGWPTGCASHEVTAVDVCGIATDYCVRATALDAAGAGFATRLLTALCAGVAPGVDRGGARRAAGGGGERWLTSRSASSDGVLWLTFNRPEVLNAVDGPMMVGAGRRRSRGPGTRRRTRRRDHRHRRRVQRRRRHGVAAARAASTRSRRWTAPTG